MTPTSIMIKDHGINNSKCEKLLEVTIYNKLNFSAYLEKRFEKIVRKRNLSYEKEINYEFIFYIKIQMLPPCCKILRKISNFTS